MTYETIKERRIKYGISQIKLAKYSGFSPALISSWEREKSVPASDQLKQVSETLDTLIYKIEHEGLEIKKKKIQRAHAETKQTKKKIPSPIKSLDDYIQEMKQVHYPENEYTRDLHKLYTDMQKESLERAPRAISLFSGCGGLDAGFKAAGFQIVGHVEIEESARKIYEVNFPESECLGTDVCKVTKEDIKEWKDRFGTIDLLLGGPPCQGFSLAGKRDPNDIRNQLYKDYVRLVKNVKPKAFVMENVRLITSMKSADGSLFIDKIISSFQDAGYDVNIYEINSQNFGVPQSRERVFLVGVLKDVLKEKFQFPKPKFSEQTQLSFMENTKPLRTFKDAAFGLEELESGDKSIDPLHWCIVHPEHVIKWLKDVPEGHSAHENEDPNLRPPSGFNTTYKRIAWEEPCSTISTNFSMISGCRNVHPVATRSLTIREAARAQSFPDQFAFFGNWGDVRKAIGNAVPPMLAYAVAQEIMKQLF